MAVGLGLAMGVTGAASASVDSGSQAVFAAAADFWYLHSTYNSRAECEDAAQLYIWPNNPGGADDYECRSEGRRWGLWLGFLS
ncbi:hypothetical protein WME99_05015 [Sorangium sp. So ce136]|uniref:hypothetical protein n=1 Tax=Sorangium sp. So ce136 TaxID=3133284 RepID=UPI003F087001